MARANPERAAREPHPMNLTPLSAGSLLALATLCVANAQSPPLGTFSLATTYDDGVLRVELPLRDETEVTRRVPVGRARKRGEIDG